MESEQGKLFVGGISRETTDDVLKDHFRKYGTVVSSVVAKDRNTKAPRGFGFVLFSEPSSADRALQDTHVILGRTVEVKKAIPRNEQHQNQQQQQQLHHNPNQQRISGFSRNDIDAADSNYQFRTRKIFVGGLSASLTEEEFKNYFERFGRITDVVVMHDSSTNRPRGFGFVTFESEESVENVMQKSFHELNNRFVEVKRAIPKEGNHGGNNYHNMKTGGVRGSLYNGVQPVEYSSNNSHGYGIFPGYPPVPGYIYGTSAYGSGYPMVGYGRIGYGITQVTPSPRGPLYFPVMLGARVFPLPYGSASMYPAYMNGGVGLMGTVAGGYHGIVGTGVDAKLNQVLGGLGDPSANAMPPQIEGVNLDSDSLGSKECRGVASGEQDQKGVDQQLKPLPVASTR